MTEASVTGKLLAKSAINRPVILPLSLGKPFGISDNQSEQSNSPLNIYSVRYLKINFNFTIKSIKYATVIIVVKKTCIFQILQYNYNVINLTEVENNVSISKRNA